MERKRHSGADKRLSTPEQNVKYIKPIFYSLYSIFYVQFQFLLLIQTSTYTNINELL